MLASSGAELQIVDDVHAGLDCKSTVPAPRVAVVGFDVRRRKRALCDGAGGVSPWIDSSVTSPRGDM